MVVRSVALPKISGASREQETPAPPAGTGDVEPASEPKARIVRGFVIVPMIVLTQALWLAALGYGALRFLVF
jgi:hypothetical protein